MAVETILDELKQMERPITEDTRTFLLADLRAHPTDLDSRRPTSSTFWKKGNVYFHSLQDTLYVHGVFTENRGGEGFIKECQACFVKDLNFYLKHFPQEETEMRKLFELIFRVGTSAYWEQDRELLLGLHNTYWTLDREIIKPWTRQG